MPEGGGASDWNPPSQNISHTDIRENRNLNLDLNKPLIETYGIFLKFTKIPLP